MQNSYLPAVKRRCPSPSSSAEGVMIELSAGFLFNALHIDQCHLELLNIWSVVISINKFISHCGLSPDIKFLCEM